MGTVAEATVEQYAMQHWVTRQMREDSALDVDAMLGAELFARAASDALSPIADSLVVEWHDRESDPLAMLGLPDDDPRREMWMRGDLFMALTSCRVIRRSTE